jgi:uncharacterized protein YjbJ (UPF0337 family)
MTSWTLGKENEEIGERQLSDNDPSNNLEGIGRKVEGEVEQGIDNLGDTISGKQNDLQGKEQNYANRADQWTKDRVNDMENAADKAENWTENRANDLKHKTGMD